MSTRALHRKLLLSTATLVGALAGYGRSAYAQATGGACYNSGGSTYQCRGSYTVLQTVTANDAQVTVVTPGLIVDTTGTGGNAITITGAGKLGAKEPSADDHTDIEAGFRVVEALGRLDVGQAAVVVKGHVLAVEAAEGTDAMLSRCAELRRVGKRRLTRAGVLVKAPKSGQEERVDLPTIGPETIKGAAAAGLAGIAVTAEHVLIADRAATITAADAHELFIFGRRASEPHG